MHSDQSNSLVDERPARAVIVSLEPCERALVIHWKDGHTSTFHYIWLRDNCFCAQCRHPTSHQRLFETADLPSSITPRSVRLSDAGVVEVVWSPDNHLSIFQPSWLRSHCYSGKERANRRRRPRLWGAELDVSQVEFDYAKLLSGDAGVLRWLEMVCDYGFAIAHHVPPVSREVERAASLMGIVQETNFGRWFDIVSAPEPGHLAYSTMRLRPHTDDAYSYWPPGVDLFHCLAPAPIGGTTMLIDGFNVVARLRREQYDAFRILSRVGCPFEYQDDSTDLRATGRIICLDDDGDVVGLRWNERLAGPLDLPEELVEPFYAAYRAFQLMLRRSDLVVQVPLRAGDLLAFDNHRVLHGRTAFDSTSGHRHIRGCLITRDSFHSRLRTLHRRLRNTEEIRSLTVGALSQ